MKKNLTRWPFYWLLPWSRRQQDDERLRLEAQRGGLELQGLQSHEVPWNQERATLLQEVRFFRRNTIIFYMKLRWILTHWRLARKDDPGEETVHPEVSRGVFGGTALNPASLWGDPIRMQVSDWWFKPVGQFFLCFFSVSWLIKLCEIRVLPVWFCFSHNEQSPQRSQSSLTITVTSELSVDGQFL